MPNFLFHFISLEWTIKRFLNNKFWITIRYSIYSKMKRVRKKCFRTLQICKHRPCREAACAPEIFVLTRLVWKQTSYLQLISTWLKPALITDYKKLSQLIRSDRINFIGTGYHSEIAVKLFSWLNNHRISFGSLRRLTCKIKLKRG